MSLRDLDLRRSYDSDRHDILRDFYVPALSEATLYQRITGFFSSTSLAVAARGIAGLLQNNGRIQLITGAQLSTRDLEALRDDKVTLEGTLEDILELDLDQLADKLARDHVRALGWLAEQDRLDLRVAVPQTAEHGTSVVQTGSRLFHQKVGILHDEKGNRLSFSGSENETAGGWLHNVEEFKVFREWLDQELPYFRSDARRFDRFWEGNARRTDIVPLPTAVEQRLIEISPSDIEDLDLRYPDEASVGSPGISGGEISESRLASRSGVQLRDYQLEAVQSWKANDWRGILEMATGTGKTFTALGAREVLTDSVGTDLTVVAAPTTHLCDQWTEALDDFGIEDTLRVAHSGVANWKETLGRDILDLRTGALERLFIITTHATFSSDFFTEKVRKVSGEKLLIVDEVHGVGAPIRQEGLLRSYDYRLGLSATPRRWFDDEGTQRLEDYFEGIVYRFSLEQAINDINPDTGQSFLTPYNYYPRFVEFTDDEYEEYLERAESISAQYESASRAEKRELLDSLATRRRRIVKNASAKLSCLDSLVEELKPLDHTLVYCSPSQLEAAQKVLNSHGVIQHKFTYREGTRGRREYGGLSERGHLLERFKSGDYQALVAIRCLDEGVDIPSVHTAIILASTGNPRQYIQRRGRVLRRSTGKEHADIYDVYVLPPQDWPGGRIRDIERDLLSRQLKRYAEFGRIAKNRSEVLRELHQLEEDYGFVIDW